MPIIKYKDVDIHLDSKIILENVNFTLDEGDFAYIIGAVGSGKSSLLKTLYGEVPIHSGDAVLFDEYDLKKLRSRKLQALRRRIGIVFQDFQHRGCRPFEIAPAGRDALLSQFLGDHAGAFALV